MVLQNSSVFSLLFASACSPQLYAEAGSATHSVVYREVINNKKALDTCAFAMLQRTLEPNGGSIAPNTRNAWDMNVEKSLIRRQAASPYSLIFSPHDWNKELSLS